MLNLQKIGLYVASKQFNQGTPKRYLRISVQNIVIVTKNFARVTSESSLEWQETLNLPILYHKQFDFQIFEKHQFGYHPQELTNVFYGKIVIRNADEKSNNWEVYGKLNQKIGFLSANIVYKSNSKISPSQLKKKSNSLFISSIVLNIPEIKFKKAYVLIKVDNKKISTPPILSKSGQLVYIEGYQLQKLQQTNKAIIQVFLLNKDNSTSIIGEGELNLIDQKSHQKVMLNNNNGQIVGEAYIEIKQEKKNQFISPINLSKVIQTPVEDNQRIGIEKVNENTKKLFKKRSPSPTFESLFPNNSIISGQSSPISTSRIKKNSIINKNNNIIFPKQQRFMSYQDSKNSMCSYLIDRNFQFLHKHSNKYYRGASLGYGNKTDFGKDLSVPGVGRYKLPSIWDRY